MKDIFIDSQSAYLLANAKGNEYEELANWLLKFAPLNISDNAQLVVSKELVKEFYEGNRHCAKQTSIVSIFETLLRQGRIDKKPQSEIQSFESSFFRGKLLKRLNMLGRDKFHVSAILLSNRKMAIIKDKKFKDFMSECPKHNVIAEEFPSKLDYK